MLSDNAVLPDRKRERTQTDGEYGFTFFFSSNYATPVMSEVAGATVTRLSLPGVTVLLATLPSCPESVHILVCVLPRYLEAGSHIYIQLAEHNYGLI